MTNCCHSQELHQSCSFHIDHYSDCCCRVQDLTAHSKKSLWTNSCSKVSAVYTPNPCYGATITIGILLVRKRCYGIWSKSSKLWEIGAQLVVEQINSQVTKELKELYDWWSQPGHISMTFCYQTIMLPFADINWELLKRIELKNYKHKRLI